MILKVKEPQPQEFERFREGQILFTYLHLAADEALTRFLVGTHGRSGRVRDRAVCRTDGCRSWHPCRRSPAGWPRTAVRATWSAPKADVGC